MRELETRRHRRIRRAASTRSDRGLRSYRSASSLRPVGGNPHVLAVSVAALPVRSPHAIGIFLHEAEAPRTTAVDDFERLEVEERRTATILEHVLSKDWRVSVARENRLRFTIHHVRR